MKGTLQKTEQGWVVNYNYSVNKNDWETLPLHPNDHRDYVLDIKGYFHFYTGKEVEFEIVKEYTDSHTNQVQSYAKLIDHSVDTNKMVCMFEPRTDTSSATICKHCGKEKFLHNQLPDVGKKVDDTYAWETPFDFVCQDPDCPHCGEEIRLMQEDDEDDVDVADDKELFYQKQVMNPYTSDSPSYVAYEKGFIEGYNKAKEILYTEEQVIAIVEKSRATGLTAEYIIQSLKQPK